MDIFQKDIDGLPEKEKTEISKLSKNILKLEEEEKI
jgi:hypothetical protein